ncbi:MAG TPA: glutamate--tRNA ligase [Verrucomicrobiae bacterium]|jgi:glutamyl-tRNA synthetase|nr:glutamate--tRNA ligase [Verrucomicrobiae bacterium]
MSTTSSASGTTSGKIRVRFAPSPTGYLHVGGARTALFNWVFARGRGGTMILRIEDTDVERNRPELVEGILDGLRWLGVDWDEGPYFQSQRLELHREAAIRLAASGAAYYCDCPPEKYAGGDAVEETEDAKKEEGPRRITRCGCREGKPGLSAANAAIRFRVPLGAVTRFDDAVFGPREVSNDEIEDFVLLRSPKEGQARGGPTYQLSAVVDDIDMRITHVIRGSDHISNTPKQALLYRALGATPPVFAHVPLILGPDRTRLSKRHGATSVGSYRDEGFLPEAFRNFLALLGWSAGNEEFMRTSEIVEKFSLEAVSRTNAVFDRPKLEWFNTQFLQKLPIAELLPFVKGELERSQLWQPEWAGEKREWFSKTVDLLRPRTRLLPDFSTWARAFFSDVFEYDPQAREKFWKDERLGAMLGKLADALAALPDWNHDACDHALRDLAAAEGVKAGLLINAARVAIVGQAVAPPLFETMVVIGQARVVGRMRRAVETFSASSK